MGTVSSQFCVTSITDGMTIHGSLWADGTLTQWRANNGGVTPDWSVAANQPTIWLTVLKGSERVAPVTYKWYYNGQEVTAGDSRFQMAEQDDPSVPEEYIVPTLRIKANLASSTNTDLDVITISGKIESNGNLIDFSAGIEIRIAPLTGSGYHADFYFPDGGAINEAGEHIRILPKLYKDTDEQQVSQYSVRWYVNYDQAVTAQHTEQAQAYSNIGSSKIKSTDSGNHYCLWLYEGDVTDKTVVRCDFIVGGTVVLTFTQDVDDQQDPDMMYIAYGTSGLYDGNPASLHKGEEVEFKFWMAENVNPTNMVINGRYTKYQLLLQDSAAKVITDWTDIVVPASQDPVTDGWHTVTTTFPFEGETLTGGTCKVKYNAVSRAGGKLTGFIKAT